MLHEGWNMSATEAAEEMENVQAEIRERESEVFVKKILKFPQSNTKFR